MAGVPESCGYSGDGGPATSAELANPYGVSVATVGGVDQLYIADYYDSRIRKVTLGGDISTAAGNGLSDYGAGATATGAAFAEIVGVSADAGGNLYLADNSNCIIREVMASTGDIRTIAGIPPAWQLENCGYGGDGGAATSAKLQFPEKAVQDSSGNVYISDTYNCVIRKVAGSTGDISTYAGTPGKCGFSGDGGAATSAELYKPEDAAVDRCGTVYIADTQNSRIRVVAHGTINTFAGDREAGYQRDGVPATETALYQPWGVTVDAAGNVLIADTYNYRVRWVDGQGIIYTVAGDGTYGFAGDGGTATSAELSPVDSVASDPEGNIYIADAGNFRVRKVTAFPSLNASAYSLSFGNQTVGTTSKPKAIELRGMAGVTIESMTAYGAFHETNNCPGSLSTGAACTVDVTFKPAAAGAQTGSVVIKTNGLFNPEIVVKLAGSGD